MKYNYSKEKAKEVLKKYAEGGKVNGEDLYHIEVRELIK